MSTSLDEDLIILEDLDFDPACDSFTGCDAAATWSLLRTCCDEVFMYCDKHKDSVKAWIDKNRIYQFTCHGCRADDLRHHDFWWEKL